MSIIFKSIINWLVSYWIKPVKKAQREYNKSTCLNRYEPKDWKEEIFW